MGAATKSAAAARDEIRRERSTIKDLVTAILPPHLIKGIYSKLAGVVFVLHLKGWSVVLHYLDIEQFRATPLVREPFEHLIVPQFIGPQALAEINADYHEISTSGSFPVDRVAFGPAFRTLLYELNSDAFREAFEDKFDIKLSGRSTITTVRGRCGPGDGKIHTDSVSKIITVLIYMHTIWDQPGGRLVVRHELVERHLAVAVGVKLVEGRGVLRGRPEEPGGEQPGQPGPSPVQVQV